MALKKERRKESNDISQPNPGRTVGASFVFECWDEKRHSIYANNPLPLTRNAAAAGRD